MSLPERIQIGPLTYRISDDEAAYFKAATENEGHLWGKIDYGQGLIVLAPHQSQDHKCVALLHEVLHGCWHLTDRAHESDEDPVLRLSAPLLDVLRRNPELVAYLASEDA